MELWTVSSTRDSTKYSARLLTGSIVRTLLGLALVQTLFFGIVGRYAVIPFRIYMQFLIVTLVVHGLLLAVLLRLRDAFRLVPSGEHLQRVNISIRITLLRTSSIPTMVFLLNMVERYRVGAIAIASLSLIFITDLIDGKLARRLGQQTRIGQHLDSTSDYGLLMALTIVLNFHTLISNWFFLLVILRLTLQLVGVTVAVLLRNGQVDVRPTLLGKCYICALMILYSLALLALLPALRGSIVVVRIVLEYIVGPLLVASLLERTLLLIAHFRVTDPTSPKE